MKCRIRKVNNYGDIRYYVEYLKKGLFKNKWKSCWYASFNTKVPKSYNNYEEAETALNNYIKGITEKVVFEKEYDIEG